MRKGEVITMDNFPNGQFYTQDYYGEYWIENLDPKNRFLRNTTFQDYKFRAFTMRGGEYRITYNVAGGDSGADISEEDFFN